MDATAASKPASTTELDHGITYRQAFWVWVRVTLQSFGGPAGQIAVMHRILVEEKRWISENRFLHALNYCMLLPGPEAQQLATYIGWLLHRTKGGLTAGLLFVLPGFLSIMALSVIYALYQDVSAIEAVFFGLKAAVLAVVVEAVIKIGKRALKNRVMVGMAALAFIAIFFFDLPFPLIVLSAVIIGFLGARVAPDWFYVIKGHALKEGDESGYVITDAVAAQLRPSLASTLKNLLVWGAVWLVPLALLFLTLGGDNTFTQIGVFFSQAAMVTFGGAYIEWLRGNKALSSALSGITAAVVGVIFNLAVWFGLHVSFSVVNERQAGALRLFVPEWNTLDVTALVLTVISFLALFRFKLGMLPTLALSAALGLLYRLIF